MQKRIAVVYSTTEGQTEKIARHIGKRLQEHGADVAVMHAREIPLDYTLENSDAIIMGASIHVGQHQDSLKDYVIDHADTLNEMPSAFFSVSLTAHDEHEKARNFTLQFQNQTGWKPPFAEAFAGALKYTEYNFLKRALMKSIAEKNGANTDTSRDWEYTDWDKVTRFADAFYTSL